MPRSITDIRAAARHQLAERGVLLASRNRREQDMLRALADVEQFEREIAAADRRLEVLFTERDQALAQLADQMVRP